MKSTSEPTKTVLVPLSGLVSMPVPSTEEQAELLASLERESARVKGGEYTRFHREAFLAELRDGYKDYLQSR
jgi:hypothetical protein